MAVSDRRTNFHCKLGDENMTPLIYFTKVNWPSYVEKMVTSKNIDINAKDVSGKTALDYARSEEMRAVLKKAGAKTGAELPDIPAAQRTLQQQFFNAIRNRDLNEINKLLLSEDIDVNAVDKEKGLSFLALAVSFDLLPIVTRLLQVPGLDINRKDAQGKTVLMLAVQRGVPELVAELLKLPALLINERSNNGLTALDYADEIQNNYPCSKIVKMLRAHGAKKEKQLRKGVHGPAPQPRAMQKRKKTEVAQPMVIPGAQVPQMQVQQPEIPAAAQPMILGTPPQMHYEEEVTSEEEPVVIRITKVRGK